MATTPFAARVTAVVRRIPPGRVATYGDIAALAGRPAACRAVGNIMAACHDQTVPCHRVVAASGQLGGYGGNIALKRALLRAEGIAAVGRRVRRFSAVRWTGDGAARTGRAPGNGCAQRGVSPGQGLARRTICGA